jgi:hypothetical protein
MSVINNDPIRAAMMGRAYGSGDLRLALVTGEYPPPHDKMDELMLEIIQNQHDKPMHNVCFDPEMNNQIKG